ncbi:hypothetical protein JOB18_027714 [Solea senegalensis]|uniref:Uncharacterized protein n=1 Tax=Solea senegalensis TaxID=28829 RepID=A0AAV6S499_SOLSE|nr:hypothetical protein JOB18_027714 [Solea senegalensis]
MRSFSESQCQESRRLLLWPFVCRRGFTPTPRPLLANLLRPHGERVNGCAVGAVLLQLLLLRCSATEVITVMEKRTRASVLGDSLNSNECVSSSRSNGSSLAPCTCGYSGDSAPLVRSLTHMNIPPLQISASDQYSI